MSAKGRSGSVEARTLKNVARKVLGRLKKKTLVRDREADDGALGEMEEEWFDDEPWREGRQSPLHASKGYLSLGTKAMKGDR